MLGEDYLLQAAHYTRIHEDTYPRIESSMNFNDKTLVCRDCNQEFVFTSGEQEFYASKGLTNSPTRCPSCRSARKAQSGGGYNDRRGGGGGGGGYRDRGDRDSRQMYSATCSSCGGEALVPFQPRGDKPVYCSNCYQSAGSSRSNDRRSRW